MSALLDQHQRPLRDLRISLTDRCNLRCRYCMPAELFGEDHAFLPREEILSYEEITRLVRIFCDFGVRKIRLTGGEPLLRRDLPKLIAQLAELSTTEAPLDFALTTNGTLLKQKAAALKEAGLQRVTVSLDALDPEIYQTLGGTKLSPQIVLEGLHKAQEVGLGIKINAVIQKGVNESEVLPLVTLARELKVSIRFIEYMDVGNSNGWQMEHVVSFEELYQKISTQYPLTKRPLTDPSSTSRNYVHQDLADAEVGFISSVTQPFCQHCSRARLSADGQLFTCLFATVGHQLRDVLRARLDDDELIRATLNSIWGARDDRYSEQRHGLIASDENTLLKKPEMSFIGG